MSGRPNLVPIPGTPDGVPNIPITIIKFGGEHIGGIEQYYVRGEAEDIQAKIEQYLAIGKGVLELTQPTGTPLYLYPKALHNIISVFAFKSMRSGIVPAVAVPGGAA